MHGQHGLATTRKISAYGVLLCGMDTEGKNGMVLSRLCDCKGWLGA